MDADAIWNRATTLRELTAPGDLALQALLIVHGMIMNGGLLHAFDSLEHDMYERGAEGFAYFGRADVAELLMAGYALAFPDGPVPEAEREQYTTDLPDAIHEQIEEMDGRYGDLVPDDATVVAAFERRLAERPADFEPA
jgi:hypothetical protein